MEAVTKSCGEDQGDTEDRHLLLPLTEKNIIKKSTVH